MNSTPDLETGFAVNSFQVVVAANEETVASPSSHCYAGVTVATTWRAERILRRNLIGVELSFGVPDYVGNHVATFVWYRCWRIVLMANAQAPADQSLCRDARLRSLAAPSKFT